MGVEFAWVFLLRGRSRVLIVFCGVVAAISVVVVRLVWLCYISSFILYTSSNRRHVI